MIGAGGTGATKRENARGMVSLRNRNFVMEPRMTAMNCEICFLRMLKKCQISGGSILPMATMGTNTGKRRWPWKKAIMGARSAMARAPWMPTLPTARKMVRFTSEPMTNWLSGPSASTGKRRKFWKITQRARSKADCVSFLVFDII